MALRNKPLEAVTAADLQALVGEKVPEDKYLEYKESLPEGREATVEFLADFCSFANTAGGDLVFGIKEVNREPAALIGFPPGIADPAIARLANIARDAIEPRVPGVAMRAVRLEHGNDAIVIRVPRSVALPHVVKHQHHWRFYARHANGKYPLDVAELRGLFDLSERLATRLRDFRLERLGKIVGGETPVRLADGPKLVLHVVPLDAFTPEGRIGIPTFVADGLLPRPIERHAARGRFNFDGWITFSEGPAQGTASTYAQLFRNGVIEAVSGTVLVSRADSAGIPSQAYEQQTVAALADYLRIEQRLGVDPPVVVMLSLLGVANRFLFVGRNLAATQAMRGIANVIDRDALVVPELMVEQLDAAAGQVLRPAFDAVWNAAGWDRSHNYTPEGQWSGQQ